MDNYIMELETILFLRMIDELEERISYLEKSNERLSKSNCIPYFEERLAKLEAVMRKIVKCIKLQNQKSSYSK